MNVIAIVVLGQTAISLFAAVLYGWAMQKYLTAKEQEWAAERKDLLDRIQAPNFGEYTRKKVLEKKIEQQPDEKDRPPEFIS